MNKEIYDRRVEMLSFYRQGIKVVDWAPLVASKFKIDEDSVKKDWSRRRNWMHFFLKLEDPILMAKKLVSDNELLMLDADNLFVEAHEPKIQLQIMWLRLKIWGERINLMKEMGAFDPIRGDNEYKRRCHIGKLNDEKYPPIKGIGTVRYEKERSENAPLAGLISIYQQRNLE